MKISKNKKMCPKDHSTQKLGSQAKRCALQPAYRQTDTNVTTVGTLSWFQDSLLQPIIKNRPKKRLLTDLGNQYLKLTGLMSDARILKHDYFGTPTSVTSQNFRFQYIQLVFFDRKSNKSDINLAICQNTNFLIFPHNICISA